MTHDDEGFPDAIVRVRTSRPDPKLGRLRSSALSAHPPRPFGCGTWEALISVNFKRPIETWKLISALMIRQHAFARGTRTFRPSQPVTNATLGLSLGLNTTYRREDVQGWQRTSNIEVAESIDKQGCFETCLSQIIIKRPQQVSNIEF